MFNTPIEARSMNCEKLHRLRHKLLWVIKIINSSSISSWEVTPQLFHALYSRQTDSLPIRTEIAWLEFWIPRLAEAYCVLQGFSLLSLLLSWTVRLIFYPVWLRLRNVWSCMRLPRSPPPFWSPAFQANRFCCPQRPWRLQECGATQTFDSILWDCRVRTSWRHHKPWLRNWHLSYSWG